MNSEETEKHAKLFLRYTYVESKDFCSKFLTLVVAVLVFSLTFSEKVVGYPNASLSAKLLSTFAWVSMLISIVACGIGLTYMAFAGDDAVYERVHYRRYARLAHILMVVAGGMFTIGLILLIIVAVTGVFNQ